jgi:hypothetical protein
MVHDRMESVIFRPWTAFWFYFCLMNTVTELFFLFQMFFGSILSGSYEWMDVIAWKSNNISIHDIKTYLSFYTTHKQFSQLWTNPCLQVKKLHFFEACENDTGSYQFSAKSSSCSNAKVFVPEPQAFECD